MSKYKEASQFIEGKLQSKPTLGLILGSGLNDLADEISSPVYLDYKDIPHFPNSTAPGHKGRLVMGELQGRQVITMQGRFHYYEGYPMETIAFPIRVMKLLGVETLIVTNAAGGVNKAFHPGDLMLISDHIKMAGGHPLIGPNEADFGVRFPDMSNAYDKDLRSKVRAIAAEQNIRLQEGVYSYMTGPAYETPAEIRMLRVLGADAVGMSTVPEVLTASHASMKVIGISCISNMAAGILDQPITEEEVIEAGKMVKDKFARLLRSIIGQL